MNPEFLLVPIYTQVLDCMNESVKDPPTLKVAELNLLLSKHKLPVKGKKAELVERYSVMT